MAYYSLPDLTHSPTNTEWKKRENPRRIGGLANYQQHKNYTDGFTPTLALSWNHFEDPRFVSYPDSTPSVIDDTGREVSKVPWIKRNMNGERNYITVADYRNDLKEPGDRGGQIYDLADSYDTGSYLSHKFATSFIFGNNAPFFWSGYRRSVFNQDEYHTKYQETIKSSANVSIFRLVYTDNKGNHTKEQMYIAFGSDSAWGATKDGLEDSNSHFISNSKSLVRSNGGGSVITGLNALSSNYLTYSSNQFIDITFNEYVHYIGNLAGGTGLIDLTPFTINATTYIERNMKTHISSPYGSPEAVDFENEVASIKMWPKTSNDYITQS